MKLILVLCYAEHIDYGCSPIMTLILYDNREALEIKLRGKTYVTTGKLMSEYCACQVLGHATHVLSIWPMDEPDEPELSLKFYWAPVDQPLEGEQLRCIHLADSNMDKFLLNCIDSGIMNWPDMDDITWKKNTMDSTELLLHGECQSEAYYLISDPALLNSVKRPVNKPHALYEGVGQVPGQSTGDAAVDEATKQIYLSKFQQVTVKQKFRHRHQIYLICKEIGIVLHDLHSMKCFLLALWEGIKGE